MKSRIALAMLCTGAALVIFSAQDAAAFGLLGRGGCCEPTCCVAEPSCGCEADCCDPCGCRPGIFQRLRAKLHRHHGCCEVSCCEPTCCAAEPTCAVVEPSCGCVSDCCEPVCCAPRCRILEKIGGLFHRRHCCAPICCEPSCGVEPSCGCGR